MFLRCLGTSPAVGEQAARLLGTSGSLGNLSGVFYKLYAKNRSGIGEIVCHKGWPRLVFSDNLGLDGETVSTIWLRGGDRLSSF